MDTDRLSDLSDQDYEDAARASAKAYAEHATEMARQPSFVPIGEGISDTLALGKALGKARQSELSDTDYCVRFLDGDFPKGCDPDGDGCVCVVARERDELRAEVEQRGLTCDLLKVEVERMRPVVVAVRASRAAGLPRDVWSALVEYERSLRNV